MTEKSMLEKLARAALPEAFEPVSSASKAVDAFQIEAAKARVRAVLLALREPDEGMMEEGVKQCGDVRDTFTAMIDSILSEPNPST